MNSPLRPKGAPLHPGVWERRGEEGSLETKTYVVAAAKLGGLHSGRLREGHKRNKCENGRGTCHDNKRFLRHADLP